MLSAHAALLHRNQSIGGKKDKMYRGAALVRGAARGAALRLLNVDPPALPLLRAAMASPGNAAVAIMAAARVAASGVAIFEIQLGCSLRSLPASSTMKL